MIAGKDISSWSMHEVDATGPEWGDLLQSQPHLLFHEPVWAEITRIGFGGKPLCLVLKKNGKVAGGTLGFVTRVLWARLAFFGFPYGGFIGSTPQGGVLAGLLLDLARRYGITRVRVNDGPSLPVTTTTGFSIHRMTTWLLEFGSDGIDTIWKALPKKIRRDVRKAEHNRVSVETAQSPAAIDEFYSLYLESMSRKHALAKYDRRLFEALFEMVVRRNRGELLLAVRNGEILSGVLVVDSPDMSHYLFGGSRPESLSFCPNELLLWQAIRRAVRLGKRCFDFLPSPRHNPGLVRFKSKWRGTAVPIHSLDLVPRPWSMAMFDKAYSLAQSAPVYPFVRYARRLGRGARHE